MTFPYRLMLVTLTGALVGAVAGVLTTGCAVGGDVPASGGASALADSPICADMWRAEFHTSVPATSREYSLDVDPRGERSQVNLVWSPPSHGDWELRVQGPAGFSPPSLVVAFPDCFNQELDSRAYQLPVSYESPDDRTVVGVYTVDQLLPSYRIWIDVPASAGRRVSVTARLVSVPDPCASNGCSSCTAFAGCGYCASAEGDGRIGCMQGTSAGPTASACSDWAWYSTACHE